MITELRTSGPLQAGIITLVVGLMLRDTAPGSPRATWPLVVFGYAMLAALVPWLASLPDLTRNEFTRRGTVVLGVILALPALLGWYWLSGTPYRLIAWGCLLLVGAWLLHAAVTLVNGRP